MLDSSKTRPFLTGLGNLVQSNLEAASPRGETGELAGSWSSSVTGDGSVVIGSSADHARYPEWGTGTPILPKPDNKAGGFLVFYVRGQKIVTRQVKGQTAQAYVLGALKRLFPGAKISRRGSGGFRL